FADEVRRSHIPGKCLRYLTCNPFGRRICCDVDPDELSAVEPDNDEGIEQVKPIVGTTNRSMAAMSGAWLRKKVRHPWPGGPRRLTMYLAAPDCATPNPSLSSSPWMRGAPQSGFSTHIRRINPRSSVSICGRPPNGRDFQRQYQRKPAPCQRTSAPLAGWL